MKLTNKNIKRFFAILYCVTIIYAIQAQPVQVVKFKYQYDYNTCTDSIVQKDTIIINNPEHIRLLADALTHPLDPDSALLYWGINAVMLKENADSFFLHNGYNYLWNKPQRDFVSNLLRDSIECLNHALQHYLHPHHDYSYGIHAKTLYQYEISFKGKCQSHNRYLSEKHRSSTSLTYFDDMGRQYYSELIDSILCRAFQKEYKSQKLRGKPLLKLLSSELLRDYQRELGVLEMETYSQDIEKLSQQFDVKVIGKQGFSGLEIGISQHEPLPDWHLLMLNNSKLGDNIEYAFFSQPIDGHLSGVDYIIDNYMIPYEHIMSIDFLKAYLIQHKNTVLTIYFFEKSNINEDLIYDINTHIAEWRKYDDLIRSQQQLDASLLLDLRKYYCGCDFRYEPAQLSHAIYFSICDDVGNVTYCYLIPDNMILIKAITNKYGTTERIKTLFGREIESYGLNDISVNRLCLLLDRYGNVLSVQ